MFSIVVPVYNASCYLNNTFYSLLEQDYNHWECIVIDDGSTDESASIINTFVKKDSRFRYVYKKNGGLSSARNAGLKLVRGNFILFLDADDTLTPDFLQEHFLMLQKGFEITINDYLPFEDMSGKFIAERYITPFAIEKEKPIKSLVTNWEKGLSIPCHCVVFKTDLARDIWFDETLPNHEDWFFWVKLFGNTKKIAFINKKLSNYRITGSSMSANTKKMEKGFTMALERIVKYLKCIHDYENELYAKQRLAEHKTILKQKRLHDRRVLFWKTVDYAKQIKRYIIK